MFPTQARDAVRSLSSSQIREVANSAMGREDVLPFWFGETDQPTAAFIRDAAIQSLSAGETFYAQNLGRPYLRNAIAEYMSDLHGRTIETDRISVVGSGVTGLGVVSQLMLSPGDRVVAITPLWPNITEIPRISGAHVERVSLNVSGGKWSLDLDRLLSALTPETKMLIVNSPNNPTGWTISDEQIEVIATHCRRLGIWVVADEVYERLIYDPSVRSAPSFLRHMNADERLISVNSFSKAWSMTGWRAGWITAPVTMADDLAKLIEYNFSCVLNRYSELRPWHSSRVKLRLQTFAPGWHERAICWYRAFLIYPEWTSRKPAELCMCSSALRDSQTPLKPPNVSFRRLASAWRRDLHLGQRAMGGYAGVMQSRMRLASWMASADLQNLSSANRENGPALGEIYVCSGFS